MKITKTILKKLIREEIKRLKETYRWDPDWDIRLSIDTKDIKAVKKLILRNNWEAEVGGGKQPRNAMWFKIKAKGGEKEILNTLTKHGIVIGEIDEVISKTLTEDKKLVN